MNIEGNLRLCLPYVFWEGFTIFPHCPVNSLMQSMSEVLFLWACNYFPARDLYSSSTSQLNQLWPFIFLSFHLLCHSTPMSSLTNSPNGLLELTLFGAEVTVEIHVPPPPKKKKILSSNLQFYQHYQMISLDSHER